MTFKKSYRIGFVIPIFLITQIATSLTDGFDGYSSSSDEASSYFWGKGSNKILSESVEADYNLIFEDEEDTCSQLLRRRLLKFLKDVGASNGTRKGRQDDEGDDGGDDGDGAEAPAEILGLELPAAVPQFFKVVANALVSNETAASVDSGFKALAPVLQNQITGAVSLFANVLNGGSPFASQAAPPARPAAPIRSWPTGTRKPRPSQTPLRSRSTTESGDFGQGESGESEEEKTTKRPGPPKRRRSTTTTFSPEKHSEPQGENSSEDIIAPVVEPIESSSNPTLIGLRNYYSTTARVQEGSSQQAVGGGGLRQFYATTPNIRQNVGSQSVSGGGSLRQFYSTTSRVIEEVPSVQLSGGGGLRRFYSTTDSSPVVPNPQNNEGVQYPVSGGALNNFYEATGKAEPENEPSPQQAGGGGSLKQIYASTTKVGLGKNEESAPVPAIKVNIGGGGALKEFYGPTTIVAEGITESELVLSESEVPKDNFKNALLNSVSQTIRRKPADASLQSGYITLFKTIAPIQLMSDVVSSTTPKPRRRRRTTSTTESEYYDEETEAPKNSS